MGNERDRIQVAGQTLEEIPATLCLNGIEHGAKGCLLSSRAETVTQIMTHAH